MHFGDACAHLEIEMDRGLFLEAALEEKDPALTSAISGTIARAKEFTPIVKETGPGRTRLVKALLPHGHAGFVTTLKGINAPGLERCILLAKG
jgi:probable addiction module antidote protein